MGAASAGDGLWAVCGTVNTKNSYGAYVGEAMFFGVLEETKFTLAMLESNAGERIAIYHLCQRQHVLP
jgi:hypothetical protein